MASATTTIITDTVTTFTVLELSLVDSSFGANEMMQLESMHICEGFYVACDGQTKTIKLMSSVPP